ncbi:HalOD1 output domain-containing protein [Salinigranum sp.]|uniref:HalOD1 output domain-containing protein n=1 Tax=Salinigranum sp. TaxID=1966351 RepID=UPI0035679B8F
MPATISILHVDDEPDVLDLSTNLFERRDSRVSVVTAGSGAEGMDALATNDVDCVVSDSVRMPDGQSFVEAASHVTDAPIVLFTAKEWQDVASDAVAADVAEYVRKADVSDYKTVLKHVLRLTDEIETPTASNRRLIGRHDFSSPTELGVSIVHAVETAVDEDLETFEPLYDVVDPDALEAVFGPVSGTPDASRLEVRFSYHGLDLAVSGDGSIAVVSDAN